MASETRLTTSAIRAVFEDEVANLKGKVADTFADEGRYFARSILPRTRKVGPGDAVQGGVAILGGAREVQVHPYVFRRVCRNGAIMACSLQTRRIEHVETRDPEEVLVALREAVRVCAAPEVFAHSAQRMRSTRETDADLVLSLLPHLSKGRGIRGFMSELLRRLLREEDHHSAFGVMNAVTALARDTRDPQKRWDLEELGGAIAMTVQTPRPSPLTTARRLVRV